MDPPSGSCISYQLHIRVSRTLRLRIGRLGAFDFPRGSYVYTGSARKNLEARLARHLSSDKARRWHIDYLLMAEGVKVQRVVRSRLPECALNRAVPGKTEVKSFGSSDCTAQCGSHLKRLISRKLRPRASRKRVRLR
jgi:Uri superfamily endonuclease